MEFALYPLETCFFSRAPAVAVACMLGARMFPSGAGPCLLPATIARFPLSPLFARAESVSYPEQRALALTATSKIGCAR